MRDQSKAVLGMITIVMSLLITGPVEAQSCQTTVDGGSYGTLHWTLSGSPFCVLGDIQVQDLTVDPGVEVLVDPGFSIRVTGSLTAIGSSALPIRFTARAAGQRWRGLVLDHTQGSRLVSCEISLASASGLQILEAAPALDSCTFFDNSSDTNGGALRIQLGSGGPIRLTGCVLRDNVAVVNGGGLRADLSNGSRLEMFRCSIRGNTCSPWEQMRTSSSVGGGLDVRGDAWLVECEISRNRCNGMDWTGSWCVSPVARGGGAYFSTGQVTLEGCVFRENIVFSREHSLGGCEHALTRGAGLYFDSSAGTLSATACLFIGNHAWSEGSYVCTQGGALFVDRGTAIVDQCTLARNTPLKWTNGGTYCASTDESAIATGSGTVSVTSSILWNNTNSSTIEGSEIAGAVSVTSSCVEGGAPGAGNISSDPLFTGIGTSPADVLLSDGSPCIDAGLRFGGNDACSPPAKGGSAPDMGGFGGALSCSLSWALVPGISMSGLFAPSDSVSPGSDTQVSYTVYATPAYAGRTAWVFLSCTGTTGFDLFGSQIPLTLDACTLLSMNTGSIFSGVINSDGVANTAAWTVPDSFPVGWTVHAAGVIMDFSSVPPLGNLIQAVSAPISHVSLP